MGRVSQGKGTRLVPVLTAGFSDVVWPQGGRTRRCDGVFFKVMGRAQKAPGIKELIRWSTNPFLTKRVHSMASFSVPNGPEELLVAYDGKVELVRRLGTKSVLSGRHLPAQPSDGEYFARRAHWLFVCNGRDANKKYNGNYVADVGVHETPGPPSASLLVDASFSTSFSMDNTTSARTLQYRASFLNSSGHEGPVSPAGGSVTVGGGANRAVVMVSGLTQPASEDIVSRLIYKRATDSTWYLWRTLAAHETVCYDFEEPESTAAVEMVETGPPPTAKFIAFFRGRGYYVDPNFPAFVFYSDAGLPEQISSALQFLEVSADDGEPITGLVDFNDSLVVFKESSIWRITTLADGTPVLRPITQGVGSVAPRASVVAFDELIFVGRHGVYSFDGGEVRPLSNELSQWWPGVQHDYLVNAVGILDEEMRRLYIAVPTGARATLDTLLCWHYDARGWAMTSGYDIQSAIAYKGALVFGARATDGNHDLFTWGHGGSGSIRGYDSEGAPDGSATMWSVKGRLKIGPLGTFETGFRAHETQEVQGIDVFFPYAGSHTLTVNWYMDRNPVATGTMTINLAKHGALAVQTSNQDLTTLKGWNEKNWDEGTWNGERQLLQRVMFAETAKGREIEIEFVNEETDEPFGIDSFVLWRVAKGAEVQR